jgi:hypothetical protein
LIDFVAKDFPRREKYAELLSAYYFFGGAMDKRSAAINGLVFIAAAFFAWLIFPLKATPEVAIKNGKVEIKGKNKPEIYGSFSATEALSPPPKAFLYAQDYSVCVEEKDSSNFALR